MNLLELYNAKIQVLRAKLKALGVEISADELAMKARELLRSPTFGHSYEESAPLDVEKYDE